MDEPRPEQLQTGDAERSWIGVVTVLAGVLSLSSLVVGLSAAGYDVEAFSDVETYIALGSDAAAPVQWGLWLSMFGSYLLLVPVALHLWRRQRSRATSTADLAVVAGVAYILLGAAGAGILAATHPHMLREYASADGTGAARVLADFDLVRRIAEDGLQGVVQNTAGAVWFLGMGALLRRTRRLLGTLAVVVGLALVLNAVAILLDVEALRTIGLAGNVLLAPVWAIATGVWLLRSRRG